MHFSHNFRAARRTSAWHMPAATAGAHMPAAGQISRAELRQLVAGMID